MQIHQLHPIHKQKGKKRVGRGGKKGTYSGRGGKGQTARAGRKVAPIIRELIKRYPKLKGYRQEIISEPPAIVQVSALEKKFAEGQPVTPKSLADAGIIRYIKGKLPLVKILGKGPVSKKLSVQECLVSAGAKAAIEQAGGSIQEIRNQKSE